MKDQNRKMKTLTAFALSVMMLFSGGIRVYAEGEPQQPVTEDPAADQPTPVPSETPTPTPSEAPAPTPSETPVPTPDATPAPEVTVTPEPTPTTAPAATATPEPTPASGDPNDAASDDATEVSMYRLYNPNTGEHFYTAVDKESEYLKSIGWRYEGIGWVSPSKGQPVYRLYNRNGSEHHYTMNAHERDVLVSVGWRDEGTGWYSDTLQRTAVYREYNPHAFSCNHNFTTAAHEHNALVSYGWRDEGVAFYAMKEGQTIPYNPPKTVVTPAPAAPAPVQEAFYNHGNIPVFKQTDPRWANTRIGGLTMINTGCVPTSIAMAVSAIKYTTVNPVQVGQYLHDHSDTFNVINHGGNAKSVEVAAEHWGITWEGMSNEGQMADALAHGKLVVMLVGPGDFTVPGCSHAILLAGNSNGTTSVYDPYGPNRAFSIGRIWSQRSGVPYDLIGGYDGIALYQK